MMASDIHGLLPASAVVESAIIFAAPDFSRAVPSANEAAIANNTSQSMLLRADSSETQRVRSITEAAKSAARNTEVCGNQALTGATAGTMLITTSSTSLPELSNTIASKMPTASSAN